MDIGEVSGTMYGLSDTGWMNKEIFGDWFSYHFLKYAPPACPLLIIMDGRSFHFTPDFINRAAEEDIIVMCLPPNGTHRTQPLDKGSLKLLGKRNATLFCSKLQRKLYQSSCSLPYSVKLG